MPVPMQFGNAQSGVETGISMRLVWTNPAPTSNFDAQLLSLALGGYDAVIIFIKQTASASYGSFCFAPMNVPTTVFTKGHQNGNLYGRYITVTGAGIDFSTGYSGSTTGTSYAVPLYIYGIKGIK